MKSWQLLLFGILMGLLAAGLILLISSPIRGVPITLNPAPTPTYTLAPKATQTPTPIQVQIGGQVHHPGIYSIPKSTRLDELINLAGGLTQSADAVRINLAMICQDGDYFYIPALNELIPETAKNAPQNNPFTKTTEFSYPLDLNKASKEALESLPGIGPEKAEAIIAYRNKNGPFISVDDLLNVEGIGEKTLEALKELLFVEP